MDPLAIILIAAGFVLFVIVKVYSVRRFMAAQQKSKPESKD